MEEKSESYNYNPKEIFIYNLLLIYKKKYIIFFIVLLSVLVTSFFLKRITYLYSVSLNVTNTVDNKVKNFSSVGHLHKLD